MYYVHRFDPRTDLEEALRGVESMVQSGKILYPAVSNFAAYQTQRALDLEERHGWAKLVAIQPMYNILKRQAEVELLPMARDNAWACFPIARWLPAFSAASTRAEASPEQGRMLTSKNYQVRYGPGPRRRRRATSSQVARAHRARAGRPSGRVGRRRIPRASPRLCSARATWRSSRPACRLQRGSMPGQYAEIAALTPSPPPRPTATTTGPSRTSGSAEVRFLDQRAGRPVQALSSASQLVARQALHASAVAGARHSARQFTRVQRLACR